MKIYVASKFENQDPVQKMQAYLIARGHTITYDWTQSSIEGMDHKQAHVHQAIQARKDFEAVETCDLLILLGYDGMKGAYIEFGIGIALGKPVIVVDALKCHNVFLFMPNVYLAADVPDALNITAKIARLRNS